MKITDTLVQRQIAQIRQTASIAQAVPVALDAVIASAAPTTLVGQRWRLSITSVEGVFSRC